MCLTVIFLSLNNLWGVDDPNLKKKRNEDIDEIKCIVSLFFIASHCNEIINTLSACPKFRVSFKQWHIMIRIVKVIYRNWCLLPLDKD